MSENLLATLYMITLSTLDKNKPLLALLSTKPTFLHILYLNHIEEIHAGTDSWLSPIDFEMVYAKAVSK